jgi:NAD(P)-dependent dehydrogenase (short-subunit alcohol dehydrogenase family)
MDTFGRVDVLINNAGTLRDASLVNMTDSQWQHIIDLHLSAAFYLSRAVWTHMKKQAFGRIIMTASASGLYGNYGQANYSAAKMALVGLANTLAKEGQRYNIKVNSIAPIAKSTMTEKLLPPDIAKLLSPEAIVPLVLYLSHPSCSENGAIFEAGGGYFTKVAIVRGKGMRLQASSDDVEEICRQMKSQIGVFRVESDAPDGPVAINSRLGDASGLEDSIKLIISSSL